MGAQYAIMRFAKYKGGAIGGIEAHNERKKEKYASNPDVDTSRSDQNYHLISPPQSYRAECNKQITEANCRVRSDSVKMVEALFTASPEFFEGKSKKEVRAFFQEALTFFLLFPSKNSGLAVNSASTILTLSDLTRHLASLICRSLSAL